MIYSNECQKFMVCYWTCTQSPAMSKWVMCMAIFDQVGIYTVEYIIRIIFFCVFVKQFNVNLFG